MDGFNYTSTGITTQNFTPSPVSVKTYFRRAVKCGATTSGYSDVCVVSIGTPVSNLNYQVVRTIKIAGITTEAAAAALTDPSQVTQAIHFSDDVGRIRQSVSKQQSPLQKDVVQMNVYDVIGRESTSYLPYTSTGSDGLYKTNAASEAPVYYQNLKGDNLAISQVKYELSPLGRVIEQGSFGVSQQIKSTATAGKTTKMTYRSNALNEVRLWTYDGSTNGANGANFYSANVLSVAETVDADGHKTIEYKGSDGSLVCKKVQKISGDESSYVSTYYVYDLSGNLHFTIPPQAMSELSALSYAFTYNDAFCRKWLYANNYDTRNRLTEKIIPGGTMTCFVYDPLDRAIMSQDAEQRLLNQWTYTKYDVLGRTIITGRYTPATFSDRAAMQAAVDNYYNANPNAPAYESRNRSDFDNSNGYTNQSFPVMPSPASTANSAQLVFYFDDYDFDNNGIEGEISKGEPVFVNMGSPFPVSPASPLMLTGCALILFMMQCRTSAG